MGGMVPWCHVLGEMMGSPELTLRTQPWLSCGREASLTEGLARLSRRGGC